MTSSARHDPDPPACHLLGLVNDPASHFTYPHGAHRCYATGGAAPVDARVQTESCLSRDHVACERFLAWRLTAAREVDANAADAPAVDAHARASERPVAAASGRGPADTGRAIVIHVLRAGDSLAGVAARYGLTPEEIAAASGLDPRQEPAEGARLVIPLPMPSSAAMEPNLRSTAGPRSR